MGLARLLFAGLSVTLACERPHSTHADAPVSRQGERGPTDASASRTGTLQGDSGQPKPPDDAPEQSEATGIEHPPRSPPTGRCPPGMLLADGGKPTTKQNERWSARYGAQVAADVPDLCMETTPNTFNTHERCVASGWCVADPKIPHPCHEVGQDITGRACDYAASGPFFSMSDYPRAEVTPEKAAAHCELQGWRLPQLHEWLWVAAGGAEDRRFAWGNDRPTPMHLNAADRSYSLSRCDDPESRCKAGTERSTFALLKKDDGYVGLAPVGSYPKGHGRWGHLDLLGNAAQIVTVSDAYLLCGGDMATLKLKEVDLHQEVCVPCGDDCRGAYRCVTGPVAP